MDYTIRTILLATDLGPRGHEVLRHAGGLAHHFGARLHIVHTVEPLSRLRPVLDQNHRSRGNLQGKRSRNLRWHPAGSPATAG